MAEPSTVPNVQARIILRPKRRLFNQSRQKLFQQESLHLLQIFPVVVWKLIIHKLATFPDGLENLLNSSPFFRNLMASQRTTFLFKKVLALVAPTVWEKEGLQGLSVKDILNCRGVCLEWNHVVDKLIPGKFQYFGDRYEVGDDTCIGNEFKSLLLNEFEDFYIGKQSVSRFLHHFFEPTPPGSGLKKRNPFIWGSLSVLFYQYDHVNYQKYLKHVFSVFSKYGNYLTSISLHFEMSIHSFSEEITMMKQLLSYTPNLKELTIDSLGDLNGEYLLENNEIFNVFSKVKLLETIRFGDLPELVFSQMMRQNEQVSMWGLLGIHQRLHSIFTMQLPNLRGLELDIISSDYDFIEKLRASEVQWNLETLKIKFNAGDFFPLALFQVIQDKFATTLIKLELYTSSESRECLYDCIYIHKSRLDLPKLKILKIDFFDRSPAWLDILLPTNKNLEEISIIVDYEQGLYGKHDVGGAGLTVQVAGFENKMLESNIWDIFTNLKKIEISWKDDLGTPRLYLRGQRALDSEKSG